MCECDNRPYIGHVTGDERGFYIAIEHIKYLHKDGKVEHGVRNTEDAFWPTKEGAQKFLDLWERKGWFQVSDCDDLSVGDYYFYWIKGEKQTVLSEFDGNGFSGEIENLDFEDDDFNYLNIWFQEFEWPKPPVI